ncbi:MAG: efflux RND transporter periplasmic adaptor subunit [Desulfobacterales bacterium]|nr:efflux RND transporter periplasmic adaptor subunit [Desulfobacterales bacterium]
MKLNGNMKKTIGILAVLIAVGFVGRQIYQKAAMSHKGSLNQRTAVAAAVEIAPVQKTAIRDIGLFTGTLYPRSQFIVAPKIAGRLEKLPVNIGDQVKCGQLVAVLDNDEYVQQVNQARAELDVAGAKIEESRLTLDIARREFERAKALRAKKIISESKQDAARAQFTTQNAKYKVAMAQAAQKKAALKAAQVRLSYTRIRASWKNGDGRRVVGERFVDEGAMLAPNTSIASILDIGHLTAVIYVIERDYPKMRVGQATVVDTDAFPGRTFSGRIVRIAPLLKETSRKARVELEVPNPKGMLKPGMFVRAQIEFARHDNATVVPVAALTRRNNKQGVFLADTEKAMARFVAVQAGIVDGQMAEILETSLSGYVVTLGHHLLEDGSAIILPADKSTPEPDIAGKKRNEEALPGGRQ